MDLFLEIGKLVTKLRIGDPSLYQSVQQAYHDFLCAPDQPDFLDLTIQLQEVVGKHSEPIKTIFSHHSLEVISSLFRVSLNFETGNGMISVVSKKPQVVLDLALRYVMAYFAFLRGGFLFHGAGIIHMKNGLVFFGPSGSGKTTIARLSPKDLLLNDDLIMIDHEAGGWWMYATPFSNQDQVNPSPARYPLKAMFRLVQDQKVYLEKTNPGTALGELIANIPLITSSNEVAPRLLRIGQEIIQSVSFYRLHFLLDDTFWSKIDEELKELENDSHKE